METTKLHELLQQNAPTVFKRYYRIKNIVISKIETPEQKEINEGAARFEQWMKEEDERMSRINNVDANALDKLL